MPSLKPEKISLHLHTCGKAGQLSRAGDHAMTRHNDQQRIVRTGAADSAGCFRLAQGRCDLAISADLAKRNLEQLLPDCALKFRAIHIQRYIKVPSLPIKILLKLALHLIQYRITIIKRFIRLRKTDFTEPTRLHSQHQPPCRRIDRSSFHGNLSFSLDARNTRMHNNLITLYAEDIMEHLLGKMRFLCDETRMLTGITVAYGTSKESEHALYGRAQETVLKDGQFISCIRPLRYDSIFDLASLTKLFTSVMTMMLVERGLLALNEHIGEIDQRFVHLKDVTVFDTLCYRVCLQTPGRIDDAPDRQEGLRRLFEVRTAPPPAVRIYSDINAMVMKYVIEAKTGMALYEAIRTYILAPTGMHETYAIVPEDKQARCVCYNYEHRIVGDSCTLRTQTDLGTPHDPKAMLLGASGDLCGHAGLFSTRQDMVRFAQALLRSELISRTSLLEIATNRTGKYNEDGTYRQPLGFLCFTKHPLQRLSEVPAHMGVHALGISGFTGNHLVIDPELDCFEVFLGNRCHGRVSHITPPKGIELSHYGLDEIGAGLVSWPDGRLVPSSAKYVYQKDACLHEPIVQRMHHLGWLA